MVYQDGHLKCIGGGLCNGIMINVNNLGQFKCRLNEIHAANCGAKEVFMHRTEASRTKFLQSIGLARDQLLECCLSQASLHARSNSNVGFILDLIKQYAHASDWNLVDVTVLALCLEDANREELIQRIASASLAFHSLRMIDDAIDRHLTYKGNYPTMFGTLCDRTDLRAAAADVTLIAALLLFGEGVARSPFLLVHLQKTILGALQESLVKDAIIEYDSIISGKMISYGMVLYSPVLADIDNHCRLSVSTFLEASFRLGQLLNDLLDCDADLTSKQPNFWNIHREDSPELMLNELAQLAARAEDLPIQFRPYGKTRLTDLARYGIEIAEVLTVSEDRSVGI
jgi:hypothetical protein